MKHDRQKALMWPEEHWTLARVICICVVVLGLALSGLGLVSAPTALIATLLGIVYVLVLTRQYTRGNGSGGGDG